MFLKKKKGLPISIPYNKSYKGKIYLTYNKARESLEIRNKDTFNALQDKLSQLNNNPYIADFFEKGFVELRVRNNIVIVPEEWIKKLEAYSLGIVFEDSFIKVFAHQKKAKHVYTGKDIDDGGAWISIKQ